MAVVENPNDDPEKWHIKQHLLPFADFSTDKVRSWGSAALEAASAPANRIADVRWQRGRRVGRHY
jgi:hypothetical protein